MEKKYDLILVKRGKKVLGKMLYNSKAYNLNVTKLNPYDVTDYNYINNNNIIELTKYTGSGTDITTP